MVIDSHAHIGRILVYNLSYKRVLWAMEKYGVDFSLVSSFESIENDNKGRKIPWIAQKHQNRVLIRTVKAVKKAPDKLGALIWLKIRQELPNKRTVRLIEKYRPYIYGIKLHPYHSKTAPDDPRLKPVYDLARRFDLPIVSHTGNCEEASSEHLYNAAKANPDINFVAVHMDIDTDSKNVIARMKELPNLYGDTTWVPYENVVNAVKICGSEKVLFGSDSPMDGKDTLQYSKKFFVDLREELGEEAHENIMHKNAERLFKIKLPNA